jgi:hypothetical protein
MFRCDGAGCMEREAEAATSDTGTLVSPFHFFMSFSSYTLEDPGPAERCTVISFTWFTKSMYLSFSVLLELRMFHVYGRMKHGKLMCASMVVILNRVIYV